MSELRIHFFTHVHMCFHLPTYVYTCLHMFAYTNKKLTIIHADKGFRVLKYVSYVHVCCLHMVTIAQHCSHMFTYLYLGSRMVYVSIHL